MAQSASVEQTGEPEDLEGLSGRFYLILVETQSQLVGSKGLLRTF